MSGIPARIGGYSVVREIGRGASATVYLATDSRSRREVALKLLHHLAPEGDSGVRARMNSSFRNEAALVGRLKHPCIVALLEAVDEPGASYVVMEYVAGANLTGFTAPGKLLPLERVLEVIFKVSRALEYAHRQGVIHRDIKPANILVTPGFEVKLSDFGIALLSDATHTQILNAGSPSYMSPEQLTDQPLTQQTDIYSLGVVMYHLLTGRRPFASSSQASLMHQILNADPPPLRALRPDLPEAFEAIVARAMRKRLSERYSSWTEFGKDMFGLMRDIAARDEAAPDTRQFDTLRGLPMFRAFREIEVWEVLGFAAWPEFAAGETIVEEGSRGESMFLIVEGEAEVTRGARHVATLRAAEWFGQMLYFDPDPGERRTAVRALGRVLALEIKAARLAKASEACQVQFNKALIRILIGRLAGSGRSQDQGLETHGRSPACADRGEPRGAKGGA